MSQESKELEQLHHRLQTLIAGTNTEVLWNARIPDPDTPEQLRQIDVLISAGGAKTSVECRLRQGQQSVMWVEELIGRRISLKLDGMIAVSYDGFTRPAKIKAKRYGIHLIDHKELSDLEIASWGNAAKVVTKYVVFQKLEIYAAIPFGSFNLVSNYPIFASSSSSDGYTAIMDLIRDDVVSAPNSVITKQLNPAGFLVDNIQVRDLKVEFSGQVSEIETKCVSAQTIGDPNIPSLVRDSSVQKFDHGVSEIIRNRDDVAFTIDISNVQAPANSILHEFSVEFSSQVELKKYELVGTRKLNTPATVIALNVSPYI